MLILASSSPRRKQILNFFSLPFLQSPPSFDEMSVPFRGDPKTYAEEVARGKAREVSAKHPDQLVLSADTIVYGKDKLYLKPESRSHAFKMLEELSGESHSVFTAICLIGQGQEQLGCEETRVFFNPLSQEEISLYLELEAYQDKSGSYFIDSCGSLLSKRIEGCFYNVMGLPVNLLSSLLRLFGINLWRHLRV